MTDLIELDSRSADYSRLESFFTKAYGIDASTNDQVPHVYRIFEIEQIQSGLKQRYEEYRSRVGNETFLFHGTTRKCTVGDPGADAKLCHDCPLCNIMEGGYKIAYARRDGLLGAGLYSAKMSSKSVAYAKNIETAEDSRYKAIMVNAVSLGRTIDTDRWFKYLKEVPDGYNSVHGVCHTQFGSDELVVYNEDALRPAFLIICDNVKVRTFPDVDTPAELALSQWVSKWLDNKVSVADYIEGLEGNPHAAELEAIRVGAEVEMCVDTAHDVRQEVGGFCEEIEEIGHSIRSWWKSSR